MTDLIEAFPPLGLKIISEEVLLRPGSDQEIINLSEEAFDNVLASDNHHYLAGPVGKWGSLGAARQGMLQYNWAWRANISPDNWRLVFLVFPLGERSPVGAIDLRAKDFANQLSITTGSWLLSHWQGKGLGLAARQALLQFAFDQLGARWAESRAVLDNQASNRVSEKLGYQKVGTVVDSEGRESQRWLLKREDFNDYCDLAVLGFDRCRPILGLSQA